MKGALYLELRQRIMVGCTGIECNCKKIPLWEQGYIWKIKMWETENSNSFGRFLQIYVKEKQSNLDFSPQFGSHSKHFSSNELFLSETDVGSKPPFISLKKCGCDAPSELILGGIVFKKQRWVAFWLNSNRLLSAASKTQKEDKIRIWGQNSSFSCFLGYLSKGQIGDDVKLRYRAYIYWVLPRMRYYLKGFTYVEPLFLTQGLLSSFYGGGNWGTVMEVEQYTASKWDLNLSIFILELLCLAIILSYTQSAFFLWFRVKELP